MRDCSRNYSVVFLLRFDAHSYSPVIKTSGLCYVMLCSVLSNLPFAAVICYFLREYFITLHSLSVLGFFFNTEKILEVSLLKRQKGEAFCLVTIKFRFKTLQKIASR